MPVTKLIIQFAIGIVLSVLIGLFAYRRGALSKSGVAGAIIVGTAIFGFGGWTWGLVLIAFFVTSSLLSRYKESLKEKLAEKFAKGSQRDIWQALANGGAGALIALAYLFYPQPVLVAAFVAAMATVNADTWATELGVLSRRPPRLLTTWRAVEVGTSGGVTLLGTLSALAGALLIGCAAAGLLALESVFTGARHVTFLLLPVAALGGLTGSLFDSLLGATVQAIYYCPACDKETEKTLHGCGTPTRQVRGWAWLDNDMVNFLSSLAGALIGAAVWTLLA
jgi:uncharacterized protein (TIGR00297 family)